MHDPTRWHVCEDAVAAEAAWLILATAAIAASFASCWPAGAHRSGPIGCYPKRRPTGQAGISTSATSVAYPPDHAGRNSRAAALARSVAIFRATRSGVRPISGANVTGPLFFVGPFRDLRDLGTDAERRGRQLGALIIIRHPASGIRHPASGIRHPASGIRKNMDLSLKKSMIYTGKMRWIR